MAVVTGEWVDDIALISSTGTARSAVHVAIRV